MKKTLLIEMAWLLVAIILTFVVVLFLGWRFSDRTIDISLHDTSYVFVLETFLIPLFSVVCFLLFFFKEIRHRFSRALPSIITIVSGLLFIVMLTIATRFLAVNSVSILYPPLSRVREIGDNSIFDPEVNLLLNTFNIIQVIVTIIIIFVAYRLGVAKAKKG